MLIIVKLKLILRKKFMKKKNILLILYLLLMKKKCLICLKKGIDQMINQMIHLIILQMVRLIWIIHQTQNLRTMEVHLMINIQVGRLILSYFLKKLIILILLQIVLLI